MKKSGDAAKSILTVEDEKSISELCRRVIGSQGIEVSIANNGKSEYMGKYQKSD